MSSGRWNGVALIDLATEQYTWQWIPLYRTFNGIAFSKDGKQIFVSGGNSDRLYVIPFDGATTLASLGNAAPGAATRGPLRKTTNPSPGLPSIPKTGKLYLCNEGTSEIWVVDITATGKVRSQMANRASLIPMLVL